MSLKIVYSPEHVEHNPQFEIYDGVKEAYAEKPERLISIVNELRKNNFTEISTPKHFPLKHILAVHQKEYQEYLQKRSTGLNGKNTLYPSYFIMDTYTPIVSKTYKAALTAVDVALTGADYILNGGSVVYALCRPPGHHADYKTMGGYCYFNNAAVSANYLSKKGKVAILDIDFHHGNGTQGIFYTRSDVLYVSIHADPHVKFPYSSGFSNETGSGRGEGFTKNYPLPLGTTNEQYLRTLKNALREIVAYNPQYLVVSAGFDTYEKDPIGGFKLKIPFYNTIGLEIAKLNIPTLVVQEGGYHVEDLGKMAVSFLRGISA